jgi:hypothetical protein
MAPVSSYVTRPLGPDTWDDFARLVEANNGVWGGCWCMGFHPEGVGKGHTVSGNRLAKQAHVRNGTVHQILVYDGDECVGWCQYGRSAELPNINNPKAYAKGLGEMPGWRIGCLFTGSGHRRRPAAIPHACHPLGPTAQLAKSRRFRSICAAPTEGAAYWV